MSIGEGMGDGAGRLTDHTGNDPGHRLKLTDHLSSRTLDMAFVDNRGVRIHYEVEGEGFPLVIQHGAFDSIETWHELGYVNALKDAHRLILVDARGHGASDKPHVTSAYSKEMQAADIVTVLDDLKIERSDYWGYSDGWAHRLRPGPILSNT